MCSWPHLYFTVILGVFPLHHIAHVGVSQRISLKLFGREIIFEELKNSNLCEHGSLSVGLPEVRHIAARWKKKSCSLITALCVASRGNKRYISAYTLYFLETTLIGLHFAADNISLSSLKFFWWAQEFLFISASGAFRPFKVIQGL